MNDQENLYLRENEKKFLFAHGDRMALKLKQKELRKEIIKCKEIYKKKMEKFCNKPSLINRIFCRDGQIEITLELQIDTIIDCKITAKF